ncbi:MAG: high frequency lysogenization protein HflD [Methylotetracoccus sp.]|jgi:high frequency lysogenization protein|nr:high frequency lysogenization protein HflD [Methylotetracoccus sp.]
MIKTLTHQVIALAGLTQCMDCVQQIAKRGMAGESEMRTCIRSVLKIDAADVMDVYGELADLKTGLKRLEKQMGNPDQVDPELSRYVATLLFLERKLMRSPQKMAVVTEGLRGVADIVPDFGVLHGDVLARIAELYQQTISQLKPRVIVIGEEKYLRNSDNANRIRSLLLAGIRSVVLWRQCGGSRWKLLLSRSRFQREARRLLQLPASSLH